MTIALFAANSAVKNSIWYFNCCLWQRDVFWVAFFHCTLFHVANAVDRFYGAIDFTAELQKKWIVVSDFDYSHNNSGTKTYSTTNWIKYENINAFYIFFVGLTGISWFFGIFKRENNTTRNSLYTMKFNFNQAFFLFVIFLHFVIAYYVANCHIALKVKQCTRIWNARCVHRSFFLASPHCELFSHARQVTCLLFLKSKL